MDQNNISKDFSLFTLLKFVFPTIVMMVFMALYAVVDGMFVSRFVGSNALSAINVVYPLTSIVLGIGIMFAMGGGACIAKNLGEKKEIEARENFTLIIVVSVCLGMILSVISLIFLEPIMKFLGASEALLPYCMDYGWILTFFAVLYILQLLFQTFFVTVGKPNIGLWLTVAAGVSNIVFDYLFIVVLDMGIVGAALGTSLSYLVGCIYPLFYFSKKKSSLWFVKPVWRKHVIINSMTNGSSEMITNLATGVITLLFNYVMMRLLGESGIAAITIVLYTQFLFTAVYIGFANGVAPIIAYNYGSGNTVRLKKIIVMCCKILPIMSVGMLVLSLFGASYTVAIFAPVGSNVYTLALTGYHIFIWNFLFAGINIFASAMFTAVSNGLVSACISFSRTFIIQVAALLLLPFVLGVTGVWLAVPIAEIATFFLSLFFMAKNLPKLYV